MAGAQGPHPPWSLRRGVSLWGRAGDGLRFRAYGGMKRMGIRTVPPSTEAPSGFVSFIRNSGTRLSDACPKPQPVGVSLWILQSFRRPSAATVQNRIVAPEMSRFMAAGGAARAMSMGPGFAVHPGKLGPARVGVSAAAGASCPCAAVATTAMARAAEMSFEVMRERLERKAEEA